MLLAFVLSAAPARAGDPALTLSIRNTGEAPLRCLVLFGHWITQDVGPIAPGANATIAMWRGQPAGALYIPRFDGRKMMIENILCGGTSDWAETYDQIPLQLVRISAAGSFETSCRPAGKIACTTAAEPP